MGRIWKVNNKLTVVLRHLVPVTVPWLKSNWS